MKSSSEFERLFIIASVLGCISFWISFTHIAKFWQKYPFSSKSTAAVAVLLVVPIITALQLMSMLFYTLYTTFDLIRIMYESFALYIFFELMLEMLGGFKNAVLILQTNEPSRWYAVFPFCFCAYLNIPRIPITKQSLQWIRLGALQICIVRPLVGLVVVLLKAAGSFESTSAYRISTAAFWVMFIDFGTFIITFYSLLTLYYASKKNLQHHELEFKFLALKLVFFLSVCQIYMFDALRKLGIIEGTSFYSAEHRVVVFNASLFCAESIILAVLFRLAYPLSLMEEIEDPEWKKLTTEA